MLTHIDAEGRPTMVDVSDKQVTARQATAQTTILLPKEVAAQLIGGDIMTKKGSIKFESRFEEDGSRLILSCTVKNIAKTGIEMEALTGVSVAALTVYDMCKALSHEMVIAETKLMAKSGGKRDVQKS
ncbi:MAG: cyclic pyranopterin monophosphate synthase MoaC [Proteobacteria bacterium]|nr:MAG: cyclic pyranopterin monophosphate synthase MoaC [Pseudomonadota bacterium]